ncbi:hypothetical protein GWK47_027856 [Chionoecetes opilio]|uniref:Uncharacterized protein n=1 Tax=Chionoecetes opilio TaxID=41210 RepID=A0A8J8W901_CHIOP|nr:hypothetical protein GWK47_027856 [Chionoecetes opilio]
MPLEEKRNVVAKPPKHEGSEGLPNPKGFASRRLKLDKKTVASFVTKNTEKFLDLLDIDKGFLDVDPALWGTKPMYQVGARRVRGLLVTNDAGNEGALFCRISTKNPRTSRRTSCNPPSSCRRPPKMYSTAKKYGHCAT